jgi:tetratricopeptide (TPR) repeat protein
MLPKLLIALPHKIEPTAQPMPQINSCRSATYLVCSGILQNLAGLLRSLYNFCYCSLHSKTNVETAEVRGEIPNMTSINYKKNAFEESFDYDRSNKKRANPTIRFSIATLAFVLAASSAFAAGAMAGSIESDHERNSRDDMEAAVVQLSQAIKSNSKDWTLFSDRGAAYAEIGETKAALADLNKAISFNPPSSQPYYNRGKVESELERPEAAIKDYTIAHRLNPGDATVLNNRANDEDALGELDSALSDYKLAIKIDPEYAEPYNGLGLLLERLGNDQSALENFNRAIKYDPGYAKAFYNRHKVKLAFGDVSGAIRDLRRSAELYESVGQLELCDQILDDAKALERSKTL